MNRMKDLPRPYPDREFYQANMEKGFEKYPQRHENYLKFQAAQRTDTVDYLPVKLDVENVSRCNYHCTMCQVSDWPGLKRADDMTFEDYKALIDSQYGLVEIKLQGMGEPLMGQCYADMIKYARDRFIWVRSTVNGSLLHLKENYKHVIDADVCELQVSIDGATQASYEKIRRGGIFSKVMENCKMLNQYCKDVGRQRTRMWGVVQQDNFHELDKFPALAGELGFDRLSLALDLNDWGQDRWREVNDPVDMQSNFDLELASELISLGESHNVEVTFWFIDEKYDLTDPAKLCPWPFERAYISSDMRIVPCCMVANPDIVELGDATQLTEEWNNEQMVAFRNMHLKGNIPDFCQSCYKAKVS